MKKISILAASILTPLFLNAQTPPRTSLPTESEETHSVKKTAVVLDNTFDALLPPEEMMKEIHNLSKTGIVHFMICNDYDESQSAFKNQFKTSFEHHYKNKSATLVIFSNPAIYPFLATTRAPQTGAMANGYDIGNVICPPEHRDRANSSNMIENLIHSMEDSDNVAQRHFTYPFKPFNAPETTPKDTGPALRKI